MATGRLTMRKAREILRQKWVLERSHREVAQSVGVSAGVVSSTVARARKGGLDWGQITGLSEDELEKRLYGQGGSSQGERPAPDCVWIHRERRRKGVTLQLLHLEYLDAHPTGYRYTQFCEAYRRWLKKRKLSMRQVHRAGEKLFVDYSGKKPTIVDRKADELQEVELFVAVLGASSYTYAEATLSQRGADWIASHIRAFSYLGGVTEAVVPDQLKSGVVKACRYDPKVQRTYEELAQHYGTTILPARPKKPRDKAKVEVGVQVVQRWILARLRNRTFFSLAELNEAIAELLVDLNDRPMRRYGASRRELFEKLDQPELLPLPDRTFVYGDWKTCRVNLDYHVQVDDHAYSVPYRLAQEVVDVRISAQTVEVFDRGQRVASHLRSFERGSVTTVSEHMPRSHREYRDWSPLRLIEWAGRVGPHTETLVRAILKERRHPEQGYRSCLGLRKLVKRYGETRLEAACARAATAKARSYRHVEAILKRGLDRTPMVEPHRSQPPLVHDNVRGPEYYD